MYYKYNHKKRKAALLRRWLTPGKASNFIGHAPDVIKPGDRVVLCCRVSSCVQARNRNLADSEANLLKRAKQLGAVVVAVKRHVGSGYDPSWLCDAAIEARRYGAIIFAETTDRLIRNPLYGRSRQNLQAREVDLQELQSWTGGLVLATDIHPDAKPEEVRSHQRKRGQREKGRRGGRPLKHHRAWKKRRLARIETARQLREAGLSFQQIADRLNATDDGFPDAGAMTIWNWLKTGI